MPTARCPPRAGPATSWDDERPRQLPEAFGAAPGTRAAAVLSTGRGSLLALVGHGQEVTPGDRRSEEHTSELQSRGHLVCRLLLEKNKRYGCESARSVIATIAP